MNCVNIRLHGVTIKKFIHVCSKMFCIYTTLYKLCFSFLISTLVSSSPPSFLISFIYSRTVSFACVYRRLRCHNPNVCLAPFIYIHVLSSSHAFSERYDVIILKNAFLISFKYIHILPTYFTHIFRMLRYHNPNECLPTFIYSRIIYFTYIFRML